MAQIGHGYGSEYQLLRFLGHHRKEFEDIISKVIGQGEFHWEDFEYADPSKVISGDKELSGLSFLEKIFPIQYPAIKKEYDNYITKSDWQSWDAVFRHNDILYLVEAKAHKEELSSGKKEHCGTSKEKILSFFKEQLPKLPVSEKWLEKYYQLANRLATAALLNKHVIKTKVLYIYFVNGYRKRIVEKEDRNGKVVETYNLNAKQEEFEEAIKVELKELGIERDSVSSILCPPIFVNAEP